PNPNPFDGDRKDYQRFQAQMQYKLAQDVLSIGSGPGTGEFWEFLDDQFSDKLYKERACRKLQSLRQGKQTLQNFNAEFMRLAYDAGKESNTINLKTRYLTAIRNDLQDRMIAVDVPDHWNVQALMSRVAIIEENLFR
ncbi:hypothetical protein EJ02DRAFT_312612, partial [Clathrospora elynae]